MKNCPKCGSAQKNTRTICSECGADLTYPSAERTNPFDLGTFGKIMVAADILGAIAAAAIMCFFIGDHHVNLTWCITSIGLFILSAVETGIPELKWHFYELNMEFRHGISDPEPSDYYLFMRKLAIVVIPVICYIGLALYIPLMI